MSQFIKNKICLNQMTTCARSSIYMHRLDWSGIKPLQGISKSVMFHAVCIQGHQNPSKKGIFSHKRITITITPIDKAGEIENTKVALLKGLPFTLNPKEIRYINYSFPVLYIPVV